jgi:hypothetical protein
MPSFVSYFVPYGNKMTHCIVMEELTFKTFYKIQDLKDHFVQM